MMSSPEWNEADERIPRPPGPSRQTGDYDSAARQIEPASILPCGRNGCLYKGDFGLK